MFDGEPTPQEGRPAPAAEQPAAATGESRGPVISGYGMGAAALGVLAVAAGVLSGVIWSGHHRDVAERTQQTDALQAAADWTNVLINMNKDNIEASLGKLHDGTVGELNADFEASVKPYREVVQTLQSTTTGHIESVALEKVHHDIDVEGTGGGPASADAALPPGMASRTDTVMVVATSVSQNAGGQPQTVRWNLRLDVSDVDGKPLISRLVSMR
jgi:hypothetical protein